MDEYIAYENGVLLHNRYQFLRDIQYGSFGKVTLAYDQISGVNVAIKSMDKSIPGVTPMARHEISISRKLGYHENICQLLDSFDTANFIVLVLEYCEGGDLYDKITQDQLNSLTFTRISKELADALNFSHSKNIFHRDLKPENVLFNKNGEVKLADWGLATIARKSIESSVGTEKYMAPECYFDSSVNSPTLKSRPTHYYDCLYADYWSFGITMLYALFGSVPFKKASLDDDNYRKFASNPDILYDVYPSLNPKSFRAFEFLLQINPLKRDLNKCIEYLVNNWQLGLTIDEEYELELSGSSSEDLVFEMDDSIQESMSSSSPFESKDSSMIPSVYCSQTKPICISTGKNNHVANQGQRSAVPGSSKLSSMPPSLIKSFENSYYGKSWADEDELDDSFMGNFKSMKLAEVVSTAKPNKLHNNQVNPVMNEYSTINETY